MFRVIEINQQRRGFAGIIATLTFTSVTAQSQHTSYIPLAKEILDETEGHFFGLICSTGPSVGCRNRPSIQHRSDWSCLILNIKNVPFADVTMKDITVNTQIAQHCKHVSG